MTKLDEDLRSVLAEYLAIPEHERTDQDWAGIRLACEGLGVEPPSQQRAPQAADRVDTERPPKLAPKSGPIKTLSATTRLEIESEVDAILKRLDELGHGPRSVHKSVGDEGRRLYHAAAELKTAFDGLRALEAIGVAPKLKDAERAQLVARTFALVRDFGVFIARR